jgi:putative ubiquitin-RnfH superfamily antitoxin RatB of RatAB toxin-antitoxin module
MAASRRERLGRQRVSVMTADPRTEAPAKAEDRFNVTGPLCIDGREYRRRQANRRKRGR